MLNKKKKASDSNSDSQSGKKISEVTVSLLKDLFDTIRKGAMAGLGGYIQKDPTIWITCYIADILSYQLGAIQVTGEEKKIKEGIVYEGNFSLLDLIKNFTGRIKELKEIHQLLNGQSKSSRALVSISGLGGVGKTQLALMYAQLYARDYDNSILVDAENLSGSFKRLAGDSRINIKIKDINGRDKADNDIVREVYDHFKDKKSLFIFDNVENCEAIKEFLPHQSLGNKPHILITSRYQNWKDIADKISLNVFSNEEARNFVKKELNIVTIEDIDELVSIINVPKDFQLILKKDDTQKEIEELKGKTNILDKWLEKLEESLLQGREQYYMREPEELVKALKDSLQFLKGEPNITNNDTIKKLNQTLQGLPLTLQQAAAYIKQQKIVNSDFGIKDYLEEYNRYNNDPYVETVMITWQVTLDKIKENEKSGNEALRILDIMAYLAPDNIPNKILESVIGREKLADAIDLLRNYSMISQGNKSDLSNIHRLVQEVIRTKLEEQNVKEQFLSDMLKISLSNERASAIRCMNGMTFLHLAAYISHLDVVNNLLDQGADVDAEDLCGTTLLHWAVVGNDSKVVEALLDREADVDVIDCDEWTPLHFAAERSLEITTLLVDKNTNISAKNGDGETPLDLASEYGNTEVVKFLRKKQSEYNNKLLAAVNSEDVNEIINFLNKGANANMRYSNGMTFLHLAAQVGWVDVVKALLDQRVDVNAASHKLDFKGLTPLHVAIINGHLDVVKTLLDRVEDVNAQDEHGLTILHFAILKGHLGIIKALLSREVDVNVIDHDEWTPLHYAAERSLEITTLLVDKNTNISAKNNNGETPLDLASKCGNTEVVEFLREKQSEYNSQLLAAVDSKDVNEIINFLNKGANANMRYSNGVTFLHLAAQDGWVDVVKALLDREADVNVIDHDEWTPLHLTDRPDIKALLSREATSSDSRQTPIFECHRSEKELKNNLSEAMDDYSHSSSSRSVLDNPSITTLHNVSHIKNK